MFATNGQFRSGVTAVASIGHMAHTLHIGAPVPHAEIIVRLRDRWFQSSQGENVMLYTIAVVLLVLWLLGLVSGYTIGAFIHVLLVIAIVLFLVGLISGRRTI